MAKHFHFVVHGYGAYSILKRYFIKNQQTNEIKLAVVFTFMYVGRFSEL